MYSKTCVKRALLKRQKISFQDELWLHTGQKYCRMLQGEHSAILSTFIKLPFVIDIFVLSIFEWPFYTGFTVHAQLSVGARGLTYGLSIHLLPYIVCTSREGSCEMAWPAGLSEPPNKISSNGS